MYSELLIVLVSCIFLNQISKASTLVYVVDLMNLYLQYKCYTPMVHGFMNSF